MHVIHAETAPPCVNCGCRYADHQRPPVPPELIVYLPCTTCECSGYADTDPFPQED